MPLSPEYKIQRGSSRDKALLLQFLAYTYQELFPQQQDFRHLSATLEQYFTVRSPLWWVKIDHEKPTQSKAIAGLWLGNAVDQVTGEHYAHIFMLYVKPEYRRQGIGLALLNTAQNWAEKRGDQQLGLQVFPHNQAALKLYEKAGFNTHALMMLKRWKNPQQNELGFR